MKHGQSKINGVENKICTNQNTSKGQNSAPPKHVSLRSMLSKLAARKYGLVFDLVCDWPKMALSNHKPGQILIHIAWPPSCIALSSRN